MNAQRSLTITVITIVALSAAATFGVAQEARYSNEKVACPYPITLTLTGGPTGPATPVMSEFPAGTHVGGSVWSQTEADKHFGHTFRLPVKECCVWTSGVLTIQLKALQPGPKGSSTSGNDGTNLVSGGSVVASQTPWPNGNPPNTTTITYNIPANVLATNMVSFYVQDDTAVTGATLQLTGCCVRKP